MVKGIKYDWGGRELWLLFSASAMFDLRDKYGNFKEMTEDLIVTDTPEKFAKTAAIFCDLARHGEAARRHMGYEVAETPTPDEVTLIAGAAEIGAIRNAVLDALFAGMGREVKGENEVVDLGLEEIKKKKQTKR